MNKYSSITAGACQFNIRPGAIEQNWKRAEAAILEAADMGAELAVLPELWSCGFDIGNMAAHADHSPGLLHDLSGIAADRRIIIAGSLPERDGSRIFNTLHVIDQTGHVAGSYRKIHLFSLMAENNCFSPGEKAVICPTRAGNLGLMICYDLRFPELCRSLALNGADLIVVSAQWPTARIDHWDVLLNARAVENQIFVIAANRCGSDPDQDFCGHSQIISPLGTIIAHAGESAGTGVGCIDFSEAKRVRSRFSTIAERVPNAYDI